VAVILAAFSIPPFLFFIRFWGDSSNYLSGFVVFTILIGIGAWWAFFTLSESVRREQFNQRIIPLVWGTLSVGVLFLGLKHFHLNNRSHYWTPEKPDKSILLNVESNGIVFSRISHFGLSYLQEVANIRPDVTVISSMTFLNAQLFFKVSQERFPLVTIPDVNFKDLGSAFLSENMYSHPIYWEPDPLNDHLVQPYLSLDGAFFRVLDPPRPVTVLLLNNYRKSLSHFFDPMQLSRDPNEKDFYKTRFMDLGAYLLRQGQYEIALQHFQVAQMLKPYDQDTLNLLGVTYAQMQNVTEAEQHFMKVLSLNPRYPDAQRNLGILYLTEMRYKEAETALLKAKWLLANDVETNYQLGLLYAQTGEDHQAISYFENALKEDPEHTSAKQGLKRLLGKEAEE
jgi:tetratricopeptide (TPR) repeat protein